MGCYAIHTTRKEDFDAAIDGLLCRPHFGPKGYCTDTFPSGAEYWKTKLGNNVDGSLGMWHFEKWLTGEMQPNHVDYPQAYTRLLESIRYYHPEDWANLVHVLKDGTLNGEKHSNAEINEMHVSGII